MKETSTEASEFDTFRKFLWEAGEEADNASVKRMMWQFGNSNVFILACLQHKSKIG